MDSRNKGVVHNAQNKGDKFGVELEKYFKKSMIPTGLCAIILIDHSSGERVLHIYEQCFIFLITEGYVCFCLR